MSKIKLSFHIEKIAASDGIQNIIDTFPEFCQLIGVSYIETEKAFYINEVVYIHTYCNFVDFYGDRMLAVELKSLKTDYDWLSRFVKWTELKKPSTTPGYISLGVGVLLFVFLGMCIDWFTDTKFFAITLAVAISIVRILLWYHDWRIQQLEIKAHLPDNSPS